MSYFNWLLLGQVWAVGRCVCLLTCLLCASLSLEDVSNSATIGHCTVARQPNKNIQKIIRIMTKGKQIFFMQNTHKTQKGEAFPDRDGHGILALPWLASSERVQMAV